MFGSEFVDEILTSQTFFVTCIGVYFLAFHIGFGPLKYTLLSEMFSPTEQVKWVLYVYCHTRYLENLNSSALKILALIGKC